MKLSYGRSNRTKIEKQNCITIIKCRHQKIVCYRPMFRVLVCGHLAVNSINSITPDCWNALFFMRLSLCEFTYLLLSITIYNVNFNWYFVNHDWLTDERERTSAHATKFDIKTNGIIKQTSKQTNERREDESRKIKKHGAC